MQISIKIFLYNSHIYVLHRIEQLKTILRGYYDRIKGLEDKKYDIEYIVKRKDVEVQFHSKQNKTLLIPTKNYRIIHTKTFLLHN